MKHSDLCPLLVRATHTRAAWAAAHRPSQHAPVPSPHTAVELRKAVPTTLTLKNTSDSKKVGFKVKTTTPKSYAVKPNTGIVPANGSVDVQIIMQAQREMPDFNNVKDKFLVQSCEIQAGEELSSEMFQKAKGRVRDAHCGAPDGHARTSRVHPCLIDSVNRHFWGRGAGHGDCVPISLFAAAAPRGSFGMARLTLTMSTHTHTHTHFFHKRACRRFRRRNCRFDTCSLRPRRRRCPRRLRTRG